MFTPDPDLDLLPIPDLGPRGQEGTGSRIRIRNIICSHGHPSWRSKTIHIWGIGFNKFFFQLTFFKVIKNLGLDPNPLSAKSLRIDRSRSTTLKFSVETVKTNLWACSASMSLSLSSRENFSPLSSSNSAYRKKTYCSRLICRCFE
jgi:hypothetical protein